MKKIKIVCFGEILWDNLKEGRRLGGAPLNVCYHLQKMGIDSTIITQTGNDQQGWDILAELQKLNIDSSFCFVSEQLPTSTVEVHVGAGQQIRYEIVENVAWDAIPATASLIDTVSAADAFVFGSLITRTADSRRTLFELLACSRYRVFDVNLRAPFYSWEIIDELLGRTHLLKLNEEELKIIAGWMKCSEAEDRHQLEAIQARYPEIETILLTRGAQGAQCFSKGQFDAVQAMKVAVKDTVGSGDAFLAAFLAGRFSGKPTRQALQQASLLSGFIAAHHGACPPYEKQDLLRFQNSLPSGN